MEVKDSSRELLTRFGASAVILALLLATAAVAQRPVPDPLHPALGPRTAARGREARP
jgi:hypothetical protein